jgi:hypothetical protein
MISRSVRPCARRGACELHVHDCSCAVERGVAEKDTVAVYGTGVDSAVSTPRASVRQRTQGIATECRQADPRNTDLDTAAGPVYEVVLSWN